MTCHSSIILILLWATPLFSEIDPGALERLQSTGTIRSADRASAWQSISSGEVEDIPTLLSALDRADAVAANWIGSAVDRIVERTGAYPSKKTLHELIGDTRRGNKARMIALELLERSDPQAVPDIIRQLLDDPVPELRALAVAALMASVDEETDEETRRAVYQKAFQHVRDDQQALAIAKVLRELGEEVDLVEKHGYLMHWRIVGPFDGGGGDGFDIAFPPESLALDNYQGEQGIDSEVEYPGKSGPIRWQDLVSRSRHGTLDLNQALGTVRGAVAYGAARFDSAEERDVQIRLRQQNAFKLWLNGKLLMAQPIGHTGNSFDQYTVSAHLQAGPNLIVVKSCQPADEVDHPFLKAWQIGGVRVCDATGAPILASNRLPTPKLDQATSDPSM